MLQLITKFLGFGEKVSEVVKEERDPNKQMQRHLVKEEVNEDKIDEAIYTNLKYFLMEFRATYPDVDKELRFNQGKIRSSKSNIRLAYLRLWSLMLKRS